MNLSKSHIETSPFIFNYKVILLKSVLSCKNTQVQKGLNSIRKKKKRVDTQSSYIEIFTDTS